jgi:hypothetical protein
MRKLLFLILLSCGLSLSGLAQFKHPGILHSLESLNRMRDMVAAGREPWKSGFLKLQENTKASFTYRVEGAFDSVSRDPKLNLHTAAIEHDCNAAYYNALMWYITGNKAHAEKTIEILNTWSYKLRAIIPSDAELLAGLDGDMLVNAAEIIRYTYPGWSPKDIAQCETMFADVFYPVIKDFAEFANGNWGNACIKTVMGIGVFCNNMQIYQRGVDYYLNGKGNGSLQNYVINDNGQCQESGRDQQHAQLGVGNLAEAAEIAWTQGTDLYGAYNNRLLKGFEYAARYNLGQDVPFTPCIDKTGKYKHEKISEKGRGGFRPIFEMVFNHYHYRKGMDTPFIRQVIDKTRPEDAGPRPADQPGFGTLLFAIQ